MSKWLYIRDLLRFEANADGTSASLIAVERHGELIALNFTVTCLSRLMLTLPKMIDAVVQQRGNHPGLRVVYQLDMLRMELAGDRAQQLHQTHGSRRLVFTRSPGFLGINDGAATMHSCPRPRMCRCSS